MKSLVKLLDSISEWTGRIFGWVIVPLVLLTVMEVILRRFLNSPTIWSFEVLKQLFALHFMIVAAYALLYRAHVSVDVFTMMLSEKAKAVLDIITYLIFFFPFCLVCIWQGYSFAARSWAMRETSWSVFHPPLYPIKTVIVITFILLTLQGISEVIKRVYIIKGVKI
ncbi:MAG: Tripartite ATP-independent periplasmic transporter [Deltaproteobacteria bacterium ADurb.BinA179]|nr:MAG: Tripartite ATP-independent periplasmic transporter [Deltaproteobacteria bacterium ADurb.BinA179]HNU75063.1 TRAP transporter small permease subunit [Deltaproteobacteria bacterium]HOD69916.1 TRAP transporter small permease subunit [Deltaproteobacteria bacterium]HOE71432.1 TRAP transporter small permease subunit [Deltaproteobacteria bacterium]HON60635.1 TRAP transporter small permease subunit [Deltaproteobacteria bacterium]